MSLLSAHIAEAHTKEISVALGRLLTQKEKDFICWFSQKQAAELNKEARK